MPDQRIMSSTLPFISQSISSVRVKPRILAWPRIRHMTLCTASVATKKPLTKYPVIFAHGLLGFDNLKVANFALPYWRGILEDLRESGCEAYVTRVPPTASIASRAAKLGESISKITKDSGKVNVIAHSMGGLDARYFIAKQGGGDVVASLTTLATPHRGSTFADYVIKRAPRLESMVQVLGLIETGALANLSTTYVQDVFNNEVKDDPRVLYQSVSASVPVKDISPLWKFSAKIIEEQEGPNDGLVSVSSARWGIDLGTIECDHLELINWYIRRDGRSSLQLYRNIVKKISQEGL
mmetsp:Transcript_33915/g.57010  ORF Transcript_33915/g.57010 Transcript_33915/m.57010 type:complete len:296 (+) Transcript_33915:111-998(+)